MYKLHLLLEEKKWRAALLCLKDPEMHSSAREPYKEELPLHIACNLKAPTELIIALIDAHPQAAWWEGRNGNLPLHMACQKNLSFDVIEHLIRAAPEALEFRNNNDYSPRELGHKDPQVMQALNRPTNCWVQLINDEAFEEKQDRSMKEMRDSVEGGIKSLKETQEHFTDMLARIEQVKSKLAEFDSMKCDLEMDVAEMDNTYKKRMEKLDIGLAVIEDDSKTAEACAKVADVASLARQADIVGMQKAVSEEVHEMRRDFKDLRGLILPE